ncbi:MAG: hypothetical protein HYS81_03770 [Candidatus Aenigmatarchaeota archaeon]|nr:MAG: hypothetical protein HYS81_03770 [Candidatus Aenigmarchaeota archaeon]
MPRATSFIELQAKQERHDKFHHNDIYRLSTFERMNHFGHHFAKYVARLARLKDEKNPLPVLSQTLADTTIVTLSSAYSLNMNLDQTLQERHGLPTSRGTFGYSGGTNGNSAIEDVRLWLLHELAKPTGDIAKVLEEHDHMGQGAVRKGLEDGVTDISYVAVCGFNGLHLDMVSEVYDRWALIEKNRIL